MKQMPISGSIAAVIVSYNSAEVLAECICALIDHLAPEQVIVVDNASKDNSTSVALELGAELIASDTNAGFGAACNLGARSATCDLLLFVNPDVCVTSAKAQALRELARREPFGLVGPRTLQVGERGHYEPALRKILPWPLSIAREAFGPLLPRELSGRGGASLPPPGARSWLNGALLLARRTEFLGLGGFDERLFLYYEDMELSQRYVSQGLPVSVTDAITGRHALGGSSGPTDAPSPTSSAASAISSIEMVGIAHGYRSARRAWTLYRSLSWAATTLMKLTSRGPISTRSQRKLSQLHGTRAAAASLLADSGCHYPIVRSLSKQPDA
jgi:N-acetylglucosaminyl-diphospho-decaprenol L-rhamnosyltransferase